MINEKANRGQIPWDPNDFIDFFQSFNQIVSDKLVFLRNPKVVLDGEELEFDMEHPLNKVTEYLKQRYQGTFEEYYAKSWRFMVVMRFLVENEQSLKINRLITRDAEGSVIITEKLLRVLAVVTFNKIIEDNELEKISYGISLDDVLSLARE